jgi:hypothetical protein
MNGRSSLKNALMTRREARLFRTIIYMQESVVAAGFELTGEVRGFSFSS